MKSVFFKSLSSLFTFMVLLPLFLSNGLFAQNAGKFGFHGYMRSGFGVDGKGGPQDYFKAPNAEAKYRLGNETEAYIEALFKYTTKDNNKAVFDTNFRLAFVTPTSKSNDFITTTSVREAYVRMRGISKKKKTLAFWAGQRFYDRYDNHIIDFWFRDMSGFGGGFEDLVLNGKSLKLAVAFLGGSIDQLQSNGNVYPENNFIFNKTTIDVRLYRINLMGGELRLTGDFSKFSGDSLITNAGSLFVENSLGWSLGILHISKFEKGQNTFNIFYGSGVAENYKATIDQPLGIIYEPGDIIRVRDFKRFRVLNDIRINLNPRVSLMGILVYQQLNNGMNENNIMNWFTAGIRPLYHFNRYFSLVGEFGMDYTKQEGLLDGVLFKSTLAAQLSPHNKFLSRPALRAYITYACWSDAFMGMVAASSFPDQKYGLSVGIQMETWW